ncbi:HAD-IIIC family phosphatase [Lentzea aerocolonigenes]|uniref:HAD-IIIC family phosphatase n=1 Tax=Lentzea aerocolonigenes TaxID=68170 RepID=UPI00068ADFF9|nr:HAD-IIIC family phosphatase [Lentzea aerocolonigenes]MCP2243438.1 D-glyceryl-ACP synthase [Lentzea aerocolonigenes]
MTTEHLTAGYLTALTDAVREGRPLDATDLRGLDSAGSPAEFRRAGRLFAGLPGEATVHIGLLATATAGHFESILRTALVTAGMRPAITAGEYGQFDRDLRTALPGGDATLVVLHDSYFVPKDWPDVTELRAGITERVAALGDLVVAAAERQQATIVLHTVPLSAEVRDAVISWRDRAALNRCWHELNAALLGLAERHPGIAVIDFVAALADSGAPAVDARLRKYADIPYSDHAFLVLAKEFRRFVTAKTGRSRKVLAFDLDNTLWGGVLGEVGAAGVELGGLYPGNCYQDLHRAGLRLRDQGVILTLASKNDEPAVRTALTDHPEALLRPDAFSAMSVNWQPKPDGLRRMADQLGLGLGSFVFMDDSAFERGGVAHELPEVAVLAADGDPAELVGTLLGEGWFDVLDLTETDQHRPELYRKRAARNGFAETFHTYDSYLDALEISVRIGPASAYEFARLAQLAGRTNQFNLTGIRFDEAETARTHLALSCSVSDRFGDEGVVGAAWVRKDGETWHVLNLLLSCRVLGRGVELAMAAWLVRQARAAGARRVHGSFVPTARNGAAAGFWESAGFTPSGDGTFVFDVDREEVLPRWIQLTER